MNDGTAMSRIAGGDTAALAWLYEAYRAEVYRLAYMMTRQSALSEDITQEVFLTAAEKAQTYRRNISLKAWLLTITRNKTLNMLKGQLRAVPLEEAPQEAAGAADETDIEFLDSLKCLPYLSRQVVLFHIAYGLTHREIAKLTGLSHGAVRKRYERALDTLRAELEKGGV